MIERITQRVLPSLLIIPLIVQTACQSLQAVNETGSNVAPKNPEAMLAERSALKKDTIEAAAYDRSKSKIAYIGTWATSASQCSDIDTSVYDGFVVITPTSLREFEQACIINAKPLRDNRITLQAACKAEGRSFAHTYEIELKNSEEISFKSRTENDPWTLVRCHLPREKT